MIVFFSCFFMVLSTFFFSLRKKLIMMLMLECLFIFIIFMLICYSQQFSKVGVMVFVLCSLMVVDSVFSLSVLVNCGRSCSISGFNSSVF